MSEKASVKLSTKSWHYKLIKFILGSAAPTPYNMYNLCPYFWLLIFSLLVTPILAPIKGLVKLLTWLSEGFINLLEASMISPIAENWERGLTDFDVYQIWYWNQEVNKFYKSVHKKYDRCSINNRDFVNEWWTKKYGESPYMSQLGGYTEKFQKWLEEMSEKEEALRAVKDTKRNEEYIKKVRRDEKMEKFAKCIDNIFQKIGDEFRSWKNLIKWTKRTVGLIITFLGLTATFFVVNFIGRGILWLIINWSWPIFFGVLIGLAAIGLTFLFSHFTRVLIKYIEAKGRKAWWINILYYLSLVVFYPIKWIFYNFFWKILCVGGWPLITKGAIGLWNGILGFLGIFGEYFGASYTDYCPGIEWDQDEQKK